LLGRERAESSANTLITAALGAFDAPPQFVRRIAIQLIGKRYKRIALVFPEGTTYAMDDVKRIQDMSDFASHVDISGIAKWLRDEWL
jgi:hypothetical protein